MESKNKHLLVYGGIGLNGWRGCFGFFWEVLANRSASTASNDQRAIYDDAAAV
jgi:hypothetical protein